MAKREELEVSVYLPRRAQDRTEAVCGAQRAQVMSGGRIRT